MTARPATVKLTAEEYRRLADVLSADLGRERVENLIAKVIPPADLLRLVKGEKPAGRITKDMTAAFVRELADLHDGDRAADIAWAVTVAERTFATPERALEVIEFARHRVAEFEANEAKGVKSEPIDIVLVDQHAKNRVDYSRLVMEERLQYANLEGSGVRLKYNLPRSWWNGFTKPKHMKFTRMHVAWKDGDRYFGGHFDWLGWDQWFKTIENIGKGYLGGRRPPPGAAAYFWLVDNNAKFRTNIVQSKVNFR